MVILHAKATSCCNCLKLMIVQKRKLSARDAKRIVELIVRIVHLINSEHSFKAALIKWLIVSHKRQSFYQRLNLTPHFGKDGGIIGVFMAQSMNLPAPIIIVVRLWLNEGIELIDYLAIPHNNNSDGTHRTAFIVGCLEVYGCEIKHVFYFSQTKR